MRTKLAYSALLLPLVAIAVLEQAGPATAADLTAKLWRPPRPMSASDWTCGPGGCDIAPAPPYHFVRADNSGSSPKVTVRDRNNRTWSVKFGAEVIPECFAPRLLMALGYTAEITYFVGGGTIEGMGPVPAAIRHALVRGNTIYKARFELRNQPDFVFTDQHWAWNDNPFLGSRELAGLKIVMMLLSNWDANDARDGPASNTGVFRATVDGRPTLLYSVFDWGASLGKWGVFPRYSKTDCIGFANDTPHFVKGVSGKSVDFGYSGKHAEDINSNITVEDVRWLWTYLRRITPQDLRTGLEASGATPHQRECWATSLEDRIRQLQAAAAVAPAGAPSATNATAAASP